MLGSLALLVSGRGTSFYETMQVWNSYAPFLHLPPGSSQLSFDAQLQQLSPIQHF